MFLDLVFLDLVHVGRRLGIIPDNEGEGLLHCCGRFVLCLAQFQSLRRNMGEILPIPFVEHVEL